MIATLPPATWRDAPGLRAVSAALVADGGAVRIVGGAVRDALLGLAVNDVDLATPLRPETVIARLEAAGIKAVPTGIAHGTVTAVAHGQPYEVTTLRRDVATDGRRATVAFADDWAEDAARRDFTVNALYADPVSGSISDYHDGLADLSARRVRFIGDAGQRIDEDHLRILRYFRFAARFADQFDPATLAVIRGRAESLKSLSRERIADELLRLLGLADPVAAVAVMEAQGVLAPILPELGEDAVARLTTLVAAERAAGLAPDAVRRLIALLPPAPADADGIATRLKLSNRIRKRIAAARGPAPDEPAPRQIAYRLGSEAAVDRALLAGDGTATVAALDGWVPPRLPVGGGALVARGISAGPEVARRLRALEDRWVAEGFPEGERFAALLAEATR